MKRAEGSSEAERAGEIRQYTAALKNRTTMLLEQGGMDLLARRCVAIAGCGGVGGATAITLARLGVGKFILADPGIFDEPDGNRQWAGSRSTLGRNKAEVYEELLRSINPELEITTYREGVTEENVDAFMAPADLLVDCLDISVPLTLRTRVYRRAMEQGIYSVSAPIFGFGTLVLFSAPGGMGMDAIIERFVETASRDSKLPHGFGTYFFRPFVDAIERQIHTHRVPSSAISVVIATGLISAEIALIFLRARYPQSREPICLPDLLAVDPIQGVFERLDYREIFDEGAASPRAGAASGAGPAAGEVARAAALEAAGHNVVHLPGACIETELLTDSWSELRWEPEHGFASAPAPDAGSPEASASELLTRLYGYEHILPLSRGRAAEALMAPLLFASGRRILCNALFPTTAFHVEAQGAQLLELGIPEATDPASAHPFKANLDLARVERELERGEVGAIYVEPCNNALGGHPISLENLEALHALARARGIPLILDGARLHANAVLLAEREASCLGKPLEAIVLALCAASDLCVSSLSKEFKTPLGGFVGMRDPELFVRARERALMTGEGLDSTELGALAAILEQGARAREAARARTRRVHALGEALGARGIPVLRPLGGHAVYLDVAAILPGRAADSFPSEALAAHLFTRSGARIGCNMISEFQRGLGVAPLRIALPIEQELDLEALAESLGRALSSAAEAPRLRQAAGPGGLLQRYGGRFERDA